MASPSSSSASGGERSPSPVKAPRRIVVTHLLPLRAEPNPDAPHGFDFSLDADALPLQLSRGLPRPVVFVGALPSAAASIPASDELAADLLARFSCSPVFLDAGLHKDFYDGFCKHYLWPMLHYLLPLTPYSISVGGGLTFDERLYRAYLAANTNYADRVCELLDPEEDLVFIHDYHLWALPTLLRHKSTRARIGFFLHSPFPSSEIFRTIPVREELLRALLNADLVGFHTYDYARHFLSACCRLLGVNNHARRGYIGIDYFGRTVVVKILPAGVDMEQLREVLSSPETAAKAEEIATKFAGRKVLLGVDDVDLFKGIGLKLVAMEKLLESRKELRGELVLVQINNPARSPGRDIDTVREEVQVMRDRINARFSSPGYEPIVTIDDPLTMHEKLAFYTSADICIVTAVRDGLSRIPYIYTVCRQEGPIAGDVADGAPRESAIVLSEFVGCSPSLSGAVRVNPWNAEGVADGMSSALMLNELDRQMLQEKHYSYVSKHDIVYWGRSLDQDLQRASKDNASMNILNMGLAMNFRIIVLGPNFKKLSPGDINPSYNQTGNRLILLDYDGTVMPEEVMIRYPSQELIGDLNNLCSDPNNTVFVVSGRSKDELAGWLEPCERLGISAEHGYFTRWSRDSPWESANLAVNFDWKNIAEPIMKHYTDATDGSYIETKETALVWHYEESDPVFGSCQAKELQDHLLSVLSKEPVAVKSGHKIVEVNPKDVGKGTAVRSLIAAMGTRGNLPDFILCVGDDWSDEDMFAAITTPSSKYAFPEAAEIFACTLGKKPSLAKYYLEDTAEVLKMLKSLTASSHLGGALQGQVSFEDT